MRVEYDGFADVSDAWLKQTRSLLLETGFEIETLYGDFDRSSFGPDSSEQTWITRRPMP